LSILTYMRAYDDAASMPALRGTLYSAGWWTPQSADFDATGRGNPVLDITPAEVAADRDDLFGVMLSKIPVGVTRVLDIGCGSGDFAKVLHAARPGVQYRGMDLSLEAITAATTNLEVGGNLPANVELLVGNATEYLLEATEDCDFIISSRCLFEETPRPGDRDLLRLVDSKASKGWFIYGSARRLLRPDVQFVMQEALAKSDTVAEHYFKDADPNVPRTFLTGHSTEGNEPCHPCYIARNGTLRDVPDQKNFNRYAKVQNGDYEAERAQATVSVNPAMTEYKGASVSGGLITGETTVTKANAPANADLADYEAKLADQKNFNQFKG
jgi:SAM-dependent methyltransferase